MQQSGDRVLALWNGGDLWFPGTVHSTNGDTIAIQYDDGMSEIVPSNRVRDLDWEVGSAIHAVWNGNGEWFACHIVSIDAEGRKLRVRFDDDGTEQNTPSGRCRCR
jgi:hypothetical protein